MSLSLLIACRAAYKGLRKILHSCPLFFKTSIAWPQKSRLNNAAHLPHGVPVEKTIKHSFANPMMTVDCGMVGLTGNVNGLPERGTKPSSGRTPRIKPTTTPR